MAKQVHFETDLLWVTGFMIQKALEEFIELNVKQIPHQFVLRPLVNGIPQSVEGEITSNLTHFGRTQDELVAEINYETENEETLQELYEDAWVIFQTVTDYPSIAFNVLGQIYTNMNTEDLSAILIEYSNRIHANSHLITNLDITADKDQRDNLFSIARELLKEKEHVLFVEMLENYESPYEYSVIDIYNMREIPCALGDHAKTFTDCIAVYYKDEFRKIHTAGDIKAENQWILDHFKFNGKFGGNDKPFRGNGERDLYVNHILRHNKSAR